MIQPWYERHVPESLRNEHRKPPTISSLFNRGTSVTFPKVYIRSTEGFASMASRVESAEEKEERLRRRRERDRLVIPASLDG